MSAEKAVTTSSLRRVLCVGAANGKSVKTLCFELDTTERAVRNLVDELIDEGIPVCSHPAKGYWIAATQAEVDEAAEFIRGRALHGLSRVSKLRAAFGKFTGVDGNWSEEIPAL